MKGITLKGFIGTAAPTGAIALSFENKVEIWLRILALAAGVAVSMVTVFCLLRKNSEQSQLARLQVQREETAICDACIAGHPPVGECPIAVIARPLRCPKNKPHRREQTAEGRKRN